MQKRTLYGLCMHTRQKAHAHMQKRLRLPKYYGCNLDALHDCLTDICEPTRITLRFSDSMMKYLGEYGTRLVSLLIACTGENPKLSVCIRKRW